MANEQRTRWSNGTLLGLIGLATMVQVYVHVLLSTADSSGQRLTEFLGGGPKLLLDDHYINPLGTYLDSLRVRMNYTVLWLADPKNTFRTPIPNPDIYVPPPPPPPEWKPPRGST